MSSLSVRFLNRIKLDLTEIYKDEPEGIYVVQDDSVVYILHAIIIGPKDTPYDGGFFYFRLTLPESYPHSPPKVILMTTGNNRVRFNPNLYNCGKVCLSILGTWQGPGWTSVMTTQSVLLSIRSLMCENPYYNEPGYENKGEEYQASSDSYNQNIRYQVAKVAILDMLMNSNGDSRHMPVVLQELIKKHFRVNYDYYIVKILDYNLSQSNRLGEHEEKYIEVKNKLVKMKATLKESDDISLALFDSIKEEFLPTKKRESESDTEFNDWLAEAHEEEGDEVNLADSDEG
ncbi:Ubiquitin-conjugating enzyme E2 Z [Halotydeus destructor]|nr:Ubiquitin-conjugating enzyme E2 Z [Halotydeus destructor]